MKLAMSAMIAVGAYYIFAKLGGMVYASHLDLPGVELSERAFIFLCTGIATVVGWARMP